MPQVGQDRGEARVNKFTRRKSITSTPNFHERGTRLNMAHVSTSRKY